MGPRTILLTGATGYVGGTVLTTLLTSCNQSIREASITVLVRTEEQAHLLTSKGVRAILFDGFDDVDTVQKAASQHDVVINTVSGFETEFAIALIRGLALRKLQTSQGVRLIHTSGTTNFADSPLLNLYPNHPGGVFSDQAPEYIITTLQMLDKAWPYAQRSTELQVIALGEEMGVQTCSICLPMLYGLGTGRFNRLTRQVPYVMREAKRSGYVSIVGDGKGIKNHVHIEDAARLYEILLGRALAGKDVPTGDQGIVFAANGTHSWESIGQAIATTGKTLGVLKSDEIKSLTLEEGTTLLKYGGPEWTESAFVSSAQTSSDVARCLGWTPKMTSENFWAYFKDEWERIICEDK